MMKAGSALCIAGGAVVCCPLYTDADFDAWVRSRAPAGRWQEAEEYAPIAVFLASEASAIITGQIFFADGGWTAAL